MDKRVARRHDVKLRRHCPLCGKDTNLVIDTSEEGSADFIVDLSYVNLPLCCEACAFRDTVQIFFNMDFDPQNERVEFGSIEQAKPPYYFP